MAKSRYKGKTVDILRAGEDAYVRAEVLGTRKELGVIGYLLRYTDNGREAFLPMDSIVEIQLAFQSKGKVLKFPRLKSVNTKQ